MKTRTIFALLLLVAVISSAFVAQKDKASASTSVAKSESKAAGGSLIEDPL